LRFKVSGAYAKGRTAKNRKTLAKEKTAVGEFKDNTIGARYAPMSSMKTDERNGKNPMA
jgi:hypothetical protein